MGKIGSFISELLKRNGFVSYSPEEKIQASKGKNTTISDEFKHNIISSDKGNGLFKSAILKEIESLEVPTIHDLSL